MKSYDNENWLREQNAKGLSQREIARLACTSTPTIRHRFKKFNIIPRTISEALKLKPSRHIWTDNDKQTQSVKMVEVQASRKLELHLSAIKNWSNNRDSLLSGIRKAGLKRRLNLGDIDFLERIKKVTLRELAIALSVSIGTIRRRLRSYNINNIQEYKKLRIDIKLLRELYKTKTQKECGEIFGCGISIIMRLLSDEKIDTSHHQKRILQVLSKTRWQNDEYRQKMAVLRAKQNRISGIQKILYSILDNLNIKYEIEAIVGPFTFDCKIDNVLIECNGDYWHSLERTISNDLNKSNYISNYHPNYRLYALWEHEFQNQERIVNLLKYWIGTYRHELKTIKFSDLIIKKINAIDYKPFISKHHYLVYATRGGISFGLFYNDLLIGVIIYSSPIRQNISNFNNTLEISRLCFHPEYQIKNLGSWFISKTIKFLPNSVSTIIAYSDRTHGHEGIVYKASNFMLDHIIRPDYWYVALDGWVFHKKTIYNRAKRNDQTERDYMLNYELKRIYGKEKLCYRYNIR